jgi:MFS family permease
MNKKIDLPKNRLKVILHGFFYSGAIGIAEPSTVLPVIVNYFSSNSALIGLFSSLLRGGAVVMQLYAAFHTQSYKLVSKPLKIIFIFRLITWFSIGLSIYLFGKDYHYLTIWLFGIGLFSFSFSAGFGTVYFSELIGKSFSNEYRGKTIAIQQFMAGIGAIISGGVSGWLLTHFKEPYSFAYLFFISSIIMSLGYISIILMKEFPKQDVSVKENSFGKFLKNSIQILKNDKVLQTQIVTRLLSYSYLIIFPFIAIKAINDLNLNKSFAALFAFLLLSGSTISNIFWGKLSAKNKNVLTSKLSFILIILSIFLATIATNIYTYSTVFVLAGAASDGFKLSFSNLIYIISPENKRPVYIAIQNNLTSLGLFFSIPGGILLNILGYNTLIIIVLTILIFGFIYNFKLNEKNYLE